MSNLSILWQNCLGQFRTEIAKKAWLWFAETRGSGMQYKADEYAHEVEKLALTLMPMATSPLRIHRNQKEQKPLADPRPANEHDTETVTDLMRFMLTRHANWRFGGNVKPHFLETSK